MPKIKSPGRLRVPKLPKRRRKASTSPWDDQTGAVRGDTSIRSHRAPRGRTAGRTPAPGEWGGPSTPPPARPAVVSRGRQARFGGQVTPTNQPGRRVGSAASDPVSRPSPRDRFAKSTPMARAEARMAYVRGQREALKERRGRVSGGARRQLEERATARPPRAHPMSGELARPNTTGRGVARRPAAKVPAVQAKDPTPAVRGRRTPGGGRGVADRWFGS